MQCLLNHNSNTTRNNKFSKESYPIYSCETKRDRCKMRFFLALKKTFNWITRVVTPLQNKDRTYSKGWWNRGLAFPQLFPWT